MGLFPAKRGQSSICYARLKADIHTSRDNFVHSLPGVHRILQELALDCVHQRI